MERVNQSLTRQFAGVPGVSVLDLAPILPARRLNQTDFSDYRDTLHLKPAAYAALEPGLLHSIEQLSGSPAPPP